MSKKHRHLKHETSSQSVLSLILKKKPKMDKLINLNIDKRARTVSINKTPDLKWSEKQSDTTNVKRLNLRFQEMCEIVLMNNVFLFWSFCIHMSIYIYILLSASTCANQFFFASHADYFCLVFTELHQALIDWNQLMCKIPEYLSLAHLTYHYLFAC